MKKIEIQTDGMRLDIAMYSYFNEEISRSQITVKIKSGEITLNGDKVKAGTILRAGDIVEVKDTEHTEDIRAEDIALDIVWQDTHLMIINKPRGMVVHPGAGVRSGTMLNALLHIQREKGLLRGGIVHRLDKNTAGLVIVAKSLKAQALLGSMIEARTVNRTYLGLVEGRLLGEGTINKNIVRDSRYRTLFVATDRNEGRAAVTHWKSLDVYKFGSKYVSLVEFRLETGRTHQIRVHAKSIGHALVADPEYNPNSSIKLNGQLLESIRLEFVHPITKENLKFCIEPSEEFRKVIARLVKLV